MTIAIIPARYASSRFTGKPLALLCGRPVIQWVYTNAKKVVDRVVVATDDVRIAEEVRGFGGEALISENSHACGTSRVCEAYDNLHINADIVLNIQADEPFIAPNDILGLIRCMQEKDVNLASLASVFPDTAGYDEISDPNNVKVVTDANDYALYFSRSVIPHVRDLSLGQWHGAAKYLHHIGVYAYKPETLRELVKMPVSPLERLERLEQLTWLYYGIRIKICRADCVTIGIDTPIDLEKAQVIMKKHLMQ